MTKGESRVRTSFNPSNNDKVTQIKVAAAMLINLIEELPAPEVATEANPHMATAEGLAQNAEFHRLKALAQTDVESAAMWAVKAATI